MSIEAVSTSKINEEKEEGKSRFAENRDKGKYQRVATL
jgi:hypothetical protein